MYKFFVGFILSLMMMSSLHAQSYIGSDDYIMSEFETIDIAKQRAKQKAIRNAQEQAGVFVESNTEVVNMVVTKDEIRTITAGILKVTDVKYHLTPLPDGASFIVNATVTADIEEKDLTNYLKCGIVRAEFIIA